MIPHLIQNKFCLVTSHHCVEAESSRLGLTKAWCTGGRLAAQTDVIAEKGWAAGIWNMMCSNMVKQFGIVPDRICSTSETSLAGLGQQSSHSSPNLPDSDLLLPVQPSKAMHLCLYLMLSAVTSWCISDCTWSMRTSLQPLGGTEMSLIVKEALVS